MKIYQYKNYQEYKKIQTEANVKKLDNVWINEQTLKKIKSHKKNAENILCHGVRNAKELIYFEKYYPSAKILGTEISHTANKFKNVVEWDFHNVNNKWINHFDIVYSNISDELKLTIESHKSTILNLTKSKSISMSAFKKNEGMIQVMFNDGLIYLLLKDIINFEEEAVRLNKKLDKTIKEIKKIDAKLIDKNFIENAPNKVIEEQKERLEDYQSQMKKIEKELKVISN